MIVEEEIANLSVNDLLQRFQNTYVLYDKRIRVPQVFDGFRGKPIVRFQDSSEFEDFDYKLLDISRPDSRWYWYRKEHPFFLFYRPVRQFQRGMSGNNTSLFCPNFTGLRVASDTAEIVHTQEPMYTPKEEVIPRYKKGLSVIFDPMLAMVEGMVYYGATPIGAMMNEDIVLESSKFQEEFKDLGWDSKVSKTVWSDVKPVKGKKTKKGLTYDELVAQTEANIQPRAATLDDLPLRQINAGTATWTFAEQPPQPEEDLDVDF